MAKLEKRLKRIIEKMAENSFSNSKLDEKKAEKYIQALKSLPRNDAAIALSAYLKMIKMQISKTTLQIESAIPLSQEQIDNVVKSIQAKQPVLTVKTEIKGSLLGGLRVKIGDVVFDDSVAQRITQLKGAING